MLSANKLPLTPALNHHPGRIVVLSDGNDRRTIAYKFLQSRRERPGEQIVPALDVGERLCRLIIQFIEQPPGGGSQIRIESQRQQMDGVR